MAYSIIMIPNNAIIINIRQYLFNIGNPQRPKILDKTFKNKQNPNMLDKSQKYSTRVATNSNIAQNI